MKRQIGPPKDWNDVARRIALREGGKKEVNIAQIKEVVYVFLGLFFDYPDTMLILIQKRMKNWKSK